MHLPSQLFYVGDLHLYTKTVEGKKITMGVREPLPKNFQERNGNNGERFGAYFVLPGTDRCMAACLDLDDHDGSIGLDAMSTLADDIVARLADDMVYGHKVMSPGGAGYHIWMIWDEPQQAAGVRAVLAKAIGDLGYKNGAGGIAKKQIEVFPKQDSVDKGEMGNAANLPNALRASEIEWCASVPVEEVVVQQVQAPAEQPVLKPHEIDQLLEFIVNDADTDYEHWITILAAIHQVGGTREQAEKWSKKSPKHNQAEFDKKVKSFKRKAGGQVAGAGTLKKWADEGGWTSFEVDVTEFPMAEVETGVDGEELQRYKRNMTKGRHQNKIEATSSQIRTCIARDSSFPWKFFYDEFSQMELATLDGRFIEFNDTLFYDVRAWFDDNGWEPVDDKTVRLAVQNVAWQFRTNLATEWANSLKWDGKNRYKDMLRAMGMEVNEYSLAVAKYWWTAHGSRVIEPGYQCDSIIVLISPTQGEGKSSLIRALAPQIGPLETYKDITIEQLLEDAKSGRAMRGCLIANMDEMRNFSKRESAEAKAALSKCHEEFVDKWKTRSTRFGRQCVIYATNNKTEFLDDETGNRRYYTMVVKGINLQWFKDNRDQLWAQGVAEFKASGLAWQEAAKVAPAQVAKHETRDESWEEAIRDYLTMTKVERVTVKEILCEALKITVDKHDRGSQMRVGKVLKYFGWVNANRMINGVQQKVWEPVVKINDFPADEW